MNKAEEIYSKLIKDDHNRLVLAVDFDKMQKIIDNLQQRIDKAIEYIKDHKDYNFTLSQEILCENQIIGLLDILRGESNE